MKIPTTSQPRSLFNPRFGGLNLGSDKLPTQETVDYTGPEDGKSRVDPNQVKWLRRAARVTLALTRRVEVEGHENLPESGGTMVCPTHQGSLDAPIILSLTGRDLRYMAAREQFDGHQGKLMTAMGSYPVDRESPSPTSIKHSISLLREDKGVVMFPEGGIKEAGLIGQVHPLKAGPGRIAISGRADSIVPIAIQGAPDTKFRPLEKVGCLAAAAAVTGLGVAALGAGPVAQTAVGVIGGALTGGVVGGAVGASVDSPWWSPVPNIVMGTVGAGAGALIGGAVGGFTSNLPGVGLACAALGGAATLAASWAFSSRDVIGVQVGEGLDVAGYAKQYGRKQGAEELNGELYERLVELKSQVADRVGTDPELYQRALEYEEANSQEQKGS